MSLKEGIVRTIGSIAARTAGSKMRERLVEQASRMAQAARRQRAGTRLDPAEIDEWLDSLDDVLRRHGGGEAERLLGLLQAQGRRAGCPMGRELTTPYVNTIPRSAEPAYPGDWPLERQIKSLVRWNAMAMVVRANRESAGLSGHISTYASCATLFEVVFNTSAFPCPTTAFTRRPSIGPPRTARRWSTCGSGARLSAGTCPRGERPRNPWRCRGSTSSPSSWRGAATGRSRPPWPSCVSCDAASPSPPIVSRPEVAILGVSRTREELALRDGQVVRRIMLPLSLSYDHRVINGADAARFVRYIADLLEDPLRLLVES